VPWTHSSRLERSSRSFNKHLIATIVTTTIFTTTLTYISPERGTLLAQDAFKLCSTPTLSLHPSQQSSVEAIRDLASHKSTYLCILQTPNSQESDELCSLNPQRLHSWSYLLDSAEFYVTKREISFQGRACARWGSESEYQSYSSNLE